MALKFDPEMSLASIRRVLSGSNLCARRRGGKVHIYDKPVPANPKTPLQQAVRANVGSVGRAWRGLSADLKARWRVAAARLAPEFPQSRGRLNGYTLFCHCARNCQLAGAPLPPRVPVDPRPELPRAVDLLPVAGDASTFAFLVHHGIGQEWRQLHRVVVRLSPPAARACHKPCRRDARLVCGPLADSAPVLPPSGGRIEFRNARFAAVPGERFGVWVSILRMLDGVDSGDLYVEFERTGEVENGA